MGKQEHRIASPPGPDPVMEVQRVPCVSGLRRLPEPQISTAPPLGRQGLERPMAPLGTPGRAAVVPRGRSSPRAPACPGRCCRRLPAPGPVPPPPPPSSYSADPQSRNHAITGITVLCRVWSIPKGDACISQPQNPLHPLLPLDHHRKPALSGTLSPAAVQQKLAQCNKSTILQ